MSDATTVKCDNCGKTTHVADSYACYDCMDVVGCTVECLEEYNASGKHSCCLRHVDCCVGDLLVGVEYNDDVCDALVGTVKSGGGGRHTHPRMSQAKAKTILRDGSVRGHPLTEKQRHLFGWIAGGRQGY